MNEINVGEVFYIIAKTRSLERAEDFLHRLETLPITPVSNTFTDVLEAARVKAQFPLSYVDAFAISTALRSQAMVVTGDPRISRSRASGGDSLALATHYAWLVGFSAACGLVFTHTAALRRRSRPARRSRGA